MGQDREPPEPAIAPLRLSFELPCPVEHAFTTWTTRIDAWWPADHTVTGPGAHVVLQPWLGGRIFERTTDGAEIDWGRITVLRAPHRLAYTWHLRADAVDATDVDITFHATGPASTRVDILHQGWDRLGAAGPGRRDANYGGWSTLLPHYIRSCAAQPNPTVRKGHVS